MKFSIIIFLFFFTSNIFAQKKINGISFVASNREINNEAIEALKNVNANWVALMPFAFMKSESDTSIVFNSKEQWLGERKEGIEQTAKAFKKKNIKIMLKPQIWIPRGGFTGHLKFKKESEWIALEHNYQKFILFYANVAQTTNCELFCIGTELNSFAVARPIFWNELILKIKEIYTGKITYAENWDTYKNVPFLNQLDYIGIDAYFPLTSEKTPTIKALSKAWRPIKNEIELLSKKYNKQILFTEYGYQSKDYSAQEPWIHNRQNTVNLDAQNNALAVILAQFWKKNWFAGGFLWKWYDNHSESGGKLDTDYTIQNKPSEKILFKFYE